MIKDVLQKEIEQALAVEPSPRFVAQVRQSLSAERDRRPQWLWKPAAIALTTAAVMAVLSLQHTPQIVPTSPSQSIASTAKVGPTPASLPKARVAIRRRAEPEVLINPREAEAFRNFVDDVQAQRIDPSKLQALFEAADRSREIEQTVPVPVAGLEPIVIPPLTPLAPEIEGGRL